MNSYISQLSKDEYSEYSQNYSAAGGDIIPDEQVVNEQSEYDYTAVGSQAQEAV